MAQLCSSIPRTRTKTFAGADYLRRLTIRSLAGQVISRLGVDIQVPWPCARLGTTRTVVQWVTNVVHPCASKETWNSFGILSGRSKSLNESAIQRACIVGGQRSIRRAAQLHGI